MSHISFDIACLRILFRTSVVFFTSLNCNSTHNEENINDSMPFSQSPWALPVKNKFSNILDHM